LEEGEYDVIESRLLMAVEQFDSRWSKAWDAWLKTHDIPEDEAADMVSCPYDEDGKTLAEEWYAAYADVKTAVEKEFDVEIIVDTDGDVFARHHLPDGDTLMVP